MSAAEHSKPAPVNDRRSEPRDDPARRVHHDLIFTFARECERHDADAEGHLIRIRLIVEQIALAMDYDDEDAENLGYDAMMHDVGKLHIPTALLNKQGELTADERKTIEQHTVIGEAMLKDRRGTQRAAMIARHHHEAWDGSGYPDKLQGEQIPLDARITAAADMLDALIAERSYKSGIAYDNALAAVREQAGSKLDPTVVEALMRCDRAGRLRQIFE